MLSVPSAGYVSYSRRLAFSDVTQYGVSTFRWHQQESSNPRGAPDENIKKQYELAHPPRPCVGAAEQP